MKINRIEIENFKGFEKRTFHFNPNFTVLIGDNGTGKTAVLDALAVLSGCFLLGIDEAKSRLIQKDEIRLKDLGDSVEAQLPVRLTADGIINSNPIKWFRSVENANGGNTSRGAQEIANFAKEMAHQVRQGLDVNLPVITYHGTGRLWIEKNKTKTKSKGSRLKDGYRACLSPASNSKDFLAWFKTYEISILQKKKNENALNVVKNAITNCVEEWDTIFFDVERDDLVGYSNQEEKNELPFSMLSDGVRNMIGMVADIAYRCIMLNPHLGDQATELSSGIVLIDELDLHLHPNWQKTVVQDIKKTFPKLQFIATKHSPFIVQSLKSDELINLDGASGLDFDKQGIEEIAQKVMGVEHRRSENYQTMVNTAKDYFQLIDKTNGSNDTKEIDRAKKEMEKLLEPFQEDPAFTAFLELKRLGQLGK